MSESNYIIASMESSDVPIQPVILVKSLHDMCSQFAATTLTASIDTVDGSFTVNYDKSEPIVRGTKSRAQHKRCNTIEIC